jgi:hypothetical protein
MNHKRAAAKAAAIERRLACRREPWTFDYALHEVLEDATGVRYRIIGLPPDDRRNPRVMIQALDGNGRPEGEPFERGAERDGVRLDGEGRWARRIPQEASCAG